MLKINNVKEESELLKREIKTKVVTYIITAMGLVAGLAWNEAIKGVIGYLFPLERNSIWVKFAYAFGITIFLVLVTIYLAKVMAAKAFGNNADSEKDPFQENKKDDNVKEQE